MTVSTENKVETPLSQQKVDPNLLQQKVDPNVKQDTQPHQTNESDAEGDPNWRAFREARKKDRAEREAAERRANEKEAEATALKAAMEAAFSKGSSLQPPVNQYGYQEEETEDQRIEKKVQAALQKRDQDYRAEAEQREVREYPVRLQKTYGDFNQTIAQENLDYLDFHYPEVSRPLQRLNNGYDKWSDIYLAIKKFVPNNTTAKREATRADINQSKPKSISSIGLTQPQAVPGNHILSEDRKAANWARMQSSLKGVG